MSVLILVSNGDVQRSFQMCSQDQHAQAQHWLRHAQVQLMHPQAGAQAQHWIMHELSLRMPEPVLSLSMLILATTSVWPHRDGFRQPYSNFSNRPDPLAQNRGTILMGIAVWRVAEKPKKSHFSGASRFLAKKRCAFQRGSEQYVMISTSAPAAEIPEVTDGCADKS